MGVSIWFLVHHVLLYVFVDFCSHLCGVITFSWALALLHWGDIKYVAVGLVLPVFHCSETCQAFSVFLIFTSKHHGVSPFPQVP